MSTTDRELLELAAKAAGINLVCDGVEFMSSTNDGLRFWNPLTDDGDALRLAVRFRLLLNVDDSLSHVTDGSYIDIEELHEVTDPYAATRRAIVRAAAEIGRGMP